MFNIFGKIFLRGKFLDLSRVRRSFKHELTKIRHEFEEHLQAINENSNEITANYEYTCEIENKLDKLSSRLDNIQLYMQSTSGIVVEKKKEFDVKRLNRKEQEVFLVIYTLEEEKGNLTYEDIAKKLSISEQLAGDYVTSIIEKGVPIIKRYINSKPFLKLDPEFKTLQAKENILQLSLAEFGF
ncbi:hypothetical protein CMO83_01015 [Candidatus Woesearchaeota archaeon]|nr:hypothetical protein [Candidatus Woesearchaeota archaeon]